MSAWALLFLVERSAIYNGSTPCEVVEPPYLAADAENHRRCGTLLVSAIGNTGALGW